MPIPSSMRVLSMIALAVLAVLAAPAGAIGATQHAPIAHPAQPAAQASAQPEVSRVRMPVPADTVAITARVIDRMVRHFTLSRPGYAVYTHVRLGRPDVTMVIADACSAAEWWCDLVAGHAYHRQGTTDRSVERLERALALAPDSVRCEFMDPGRLMEPAQRRAIQRQPCHTRIAAADTVWWLADPLYSQEGNDRLAEHVSRVHEARMRAVLTGSGGTPEARFTQAHLPRWYLDDVTENRIRRGAWVSTGAAQGRNHTLDLSALDPGTYTLVLRTRWADEETIEVRRPFEIR